MPCGPAAGRNARLETQICLYMPTQSRGGGLALSVCFCAATSHTRTSAPEPATARWEPEGTTAMHSSLELAPWSAVCSAAAGSQGPEGPSWVWMRVHPKAFELKRALVALAELGPSRWRPQVAAKSRPAEPRGAPVCAQMKSTAPLARESARRLVSSGAPSSPVLREKWVMPEAREASPNRAAGCRFGACEIIWCCGGGADALNKIQKKY